MMLKKCKQSIHIHLFAIDTVHVYYVLLRETCSSRMSPSFYFLAALAFAFVFALVLDACVVG